MKILDILRLTAVFFLLIFSNNFLFAQLCTPVCNGVTVVETFETEETIITGDMLIAEFDDTCEPPENLHYFMNIVGEPNDSNGEDSLVFAVGVQGVFEVEMSIFDNTGLTWFCLGVVEVGIDACNIDEAPPTVFCESTFVIDADETETIILSSSEINEGAYDNCTSYDNLDFAITLDGTLTTPPATMEVELAGSENYIAYLWVTDESGNSNVCATEITINLPDNCDSDMIAPVAVCDADIVIETGQTGATILATNLDDGSWDNCTLAPNLVLTLSDDGTLTEPPVTAIININSNQELILYLWVTDEAGNFNSCAVNVSINPIIESCNPDVTPPLIVCNDILTVFTVTNDDFTVTPDMTVVSSSDNCTNAADLEFFITTSETQADPPTTQILTFPFDSENTTIYSFAVDAVGNYSICATEVVFNILQGVSGKVFVDSNEDCSLDAGEEGIGGYTVRYTLDQGLTYTDAIPSDASGNYNFTFNAQPEAGELTLELLMPDGLGNSCVTSYTYPTPLTDFEILDFPVQLVADCAYMHTDISAPFLRRCFPTPYTVSYCNYSTEAVDNVELTVTLDAAMDILEIGLPYIDLGNNTLLFELGTVASGDCGLIDIVIVLDCNTTLGATKCVQSSISPNDCNDPGLNWSGASLVVNGECNEDTGKVNFTITNEGTGAMAEALEFIVVEDVVMYMHTPILLNPSESETLEFDANGSTWRVAIAQEAGHPSLSSPTAFIEGCGGYGSTGMANQFAMDDVDPFISIDCQEVIAAYDPNDKRAFPEGYSEQHFIEPNTSIEYNIRFQNTGTDTAFTVRIEDRLSMLLDETSIEAGASSHPYRMEVQEDGLLIFHFENIMLPDSNVNEIASHGFVQFRAQQKADNQLGMLIENTAEIYFDFNEEIVTNTVFHTLGTQFIISETNEVFVPNLDLIVAPNPFHSKAMFTLKGVDVNDGIIELYDVFGRMVRQDSFSGNQYELNRENLPVGTYLFRFLDADKLLVNGKIIVN